MKKLYSFGKFVSWTHTYPLLILITIVLFVNRNLLKGGSFGSWDSFGGHVALISFFSANSRFFDLWNETSFGLFTPLNFVKFLGFLTKIFADAILVFNITIFLTMLGTAIGMYFFTYHFTDDKKASFISAFIFTFNQWIVAKYSCGHLMHIFPYFLLPPLFFFLYKSLDSGKLKYIVLFSIVFSLFPLMRLDPLYYVAPFVVLFGFSFIIYNFKRTYVERTAKVVLISLSLFVLLTLYLFLPVLNIPTIFATVEHPLREITLYSLNLYDSILGHTTSIMSDIYWLAGISWKTHPLLSLPLYKLLMLVIPLLAFSAVILKRDFITIYFTIAALIAIFLAKGPREPFESIYLWAYNNLPYFSGLHVPNRWLIITWFAYSFLAGISLKEISKQTKNRFHFIHSGLNAFIVIIALLSIFFGSYYIFTNGYQTYQLQEQEIEPHVWLKNKEGEYRILTVPFTQNYMFLNKGNMEADFGRSSFYFHKKPIINTILGIGFNHHVSDFANFIKELIKDHSCHELGKILGIYDVRYFVLQGYPPTAPGTIDRLSYLQHDYFEAQRGLVQVFESNYTPYQLKATDHYPPGIVLKNIPLKYRDVDVERPAKIYENSYWIPHIFVPRNQMVVVGGLDCFSKLSEIEGFFSEWNIVFVDQVVAELGKDVLKERINGANYVVFVNSEPLDLAMLLANATWIKTKNYENDSTSWQENDWPIIEGYFAYGRDVVSSKEKGAKATYNFEVEDGANYEVWIRTFLSNKAGKIRILLDEKEVKDINSYAPSTLGFKWIKVCEFETGKRKLKIEVINENGENKLNGIVVAEKGEVEKALNHVEKLTKGKSLYLLDIQKFGKFGIDPLKLFEEEVIFDDYWKEQHLWTPAFPENVKISDSTNSISGKTSLRINITPGPKPEGVVGKGFIGEGWYDLESWKGILTRLMFGNATLPIYSPKEKQSMLSFKVVSFVKSRTLEVYLNEELVLEQKIPGKKLTKIEVPITLKQGKNIVRFYTSENCQRPIDIPELKSNDTRCLSLAFQDVRLDGSPLNSFLGFENWKGTKYLSFWFKGEGTGSIFNLWIYFNNSNWTNPDAVRYGSFYDTSSEWRRIVIPIDEPAAKYGNIQWDKVSRIVFGIPDKDFEGTIYLDRFSIHKGEISEEDIKKIKNTFGKRVMLYINEKPLKDEIIRAKNENKVSYPEFKKISPSMWIAKVNSTSPYTIVFSNTYHEMWRAYVNGKEYKSIPSYYFINSFQINETGEHEVVIEFIGQRIQNISLIISGLAYLGCFNYLFYDWRRGKGDKRALKIGARLHNAGSVISKGFGEGVRRLKMKLKRKK